MHAWWIKIFSNSNWEDYFFFAVIDELGTLKIDWTVNTTQITTVYIYIYIQEHTNEMINQACRFSLAEVSLALTETNLFWECSKLSLESREWKKNFGLISFSRIQYCTKSIVQCYIDRCEKNRLRKLALFSTEVFGISSTTCVRMMILNN